MRVTGPSRDTYRTVGTTRLTIRVRRSAASIRRAFGDPAPVSTHASRSGSYWYQIGTVSGPRSGPADADKAAILRLGQEQLTIAHRQPVIRHGPEPRHSHRKLARRPCGSPSAGPVR